MNRIRPFTISFFVTLATALLAACSSVPRSETLYELGKWEGSPIVTTLYGQVLGHEDADRTWVWKAIPYAKPPVGSLRWRAPQEPQTWLGVRDRDSFPSACTQFSPVVRGWIVGSEDCLYLNIWRPQGKDAPLPVYVWIHGEGNSIGSATMVSEYCGNRLAERSRVVFVSINYRLGPFGWFTNPALREGESPEDASGNYGTLDIIQALKWIQKNIAAFGGDPDSVIVTGESAGGFNVLSLLISPPAKGLFQRAMSQSGAAFTRGMEEGDAKSRAVLEQLLVADSKARTRAEASSAASAMSPGEARDYLRSKSDRAILRCYAGSRMGMIDNPAILRDGAVIPLCGFDALSTGEYPCKVPLIVGNNKEELKLFLVFAGTPPWNSALFAAVARYGSDRWKAVGVDEVARRMSSHLDQPPVYAYQFSWGAPDEKGQSPLPGDWGRRLGAFHSLEIPFFLGQDTIEGVFQLVLFTPGNRAGRKALSDVMMDYVARFTRTGDPTRPGSGLPYWKPWTNDSGAEKCIVFDAKGESAAIVMSAVELTSDGVIASLKTELQEPLRSQTLEYLSRSRFPSAVR